LGIKKEHSGLLLNSDTIWIEDMAIKIKPAQIVSGSRVGVAYAGEDAFLRYRFFIKDNPFVSKAKGL
jgi:DNA-3-methyladenine glycosylase